MNRAVTAPVAFPGVGIVAAARSRARATDETCSALVAFCADAARGFEADDARTATSREIGADTRVVAIRGDQADALIVTLVPAPGDDEAAASSRVDGVAAHVARAVAGMPPGYRDWTLAGIRHVFVSMADAGSLNSSSRLDQPLSVRIALNGALVATQEMLVHEASHQIYNLFVDPDEICLAGAPSVYSALKRTERPLERVVFALHAAANIAACYAAGPGDGGWARERALADFASLSRTCRAHLSWLTPAGRSLVEELTCPAT